MTTKIRKEGFTLVELLVVIAIIALLATSLYPAIGNVMDMARAAGLKGKAHSVWLAITATNTERETLNKDNLWPGNIMGNDASASSKIQGTTADAYFSYLMSAGDDKSDSTIEGDANNRLVSDLTPDLITAQGIPAADVGSTVGPENCAWHVFGVSGNSASELPFMVTKNADVSGSVQQSQNDTDKFAPLKSDTDPFKNKHAVWISIGGAQGNARPKYFTKAAVMGIGTNSVEVFACAKAKQ